MGKLHSILLSGLGIFALVFLFVVAFGNRGLDDVMRMKAERDRVRARCEAIQEENAGLARAIDRLKNDPEYVERVARVELGMVADGEVIFYFPQEDEVPVKDSMKNQTASD